MIYRIVITIEVVSGGEKKKKITRRCISQDNRFSDTPAARDSTTYFM